MSDFLRFAGLCKAFCLRDLGAHSRILLSPIYVILPRIQPLGVKRIVLNACPDMTGQVKACLISDKAVHVTTLQTFLIRENS